MTRRAGWTHDPALKAKVALAGIEGGKTLAQQYDVHPNPITAWKARVLEGVAGLFGGGAAEAATPAVDLTVLHAKIGELTLANDFWGERFFGANDFLAGALSQAGLPSAKRSRPPLFFGCNQRPSARIEP